MKCIAIPAVLAACAFGAAAPAFGLQAQLVASGFSQPVFVTAPGGDARLFVVERQGVIKVLQGGVASTYLDISARVDADPTTERGLLGLAFAPDFASSGRFYVDYIDRTTKNTVVAAYTAPSAAAPMADAASARTILTVAQPVYTNHKGGWIGFRSTDPGQLYIATGDGGSGNDPDNRAQNPNDDLGKMLRVTPNPAGGYSVPTGNPYGGATPGNGEIWAIGLRNPFRNSFDRQTGDLWIGDVGQGAREEIDFEAAATPGGRNYGWRALEGSADNPANADLPPADPTGPLFEYLHGTIGDSVIGGYVYRGHGEAGLDGTYFFGDFVSGRIYSLRRNGASFSDLTDRTAELGMPFGAFQLVSFGEGADGALYAVGINGNVFRIAAAAAVPEPASWALLALGLGALAALRGRDGRRG